MDSTRDNATIVEGLPESSFAVGQLQVAATSFFALFSIVGLALYGLPFYYDFMVKDFGWTRAEVTSGNFYSKLLIGPLFGFAAGWIVDRFGPRRMMMAGILMAGTALVGLSYASTLGLFYFFYLFNALGYVCGGPLPNQVLISSWFTTARGKAMGFAYLGFERVSVVVDAYRRSVQEADLARDIDRELISYRALARYFVVTGKEDDGKAALAAEARLKDAIAASMKGTTDRARLEQIAKLEREFRTFTKIFADMLKTKDDSARIAQNQLARTGNSLRYKLDDLPSNAEDEEMPLITLGAKTLN